MLWQTKDTYWPNCDDALLLATSGQRLGAVAPGKSSLIGSFLDHS